MHSLKLAAEQVMKKHHKKVAIVRPLALHEESIELKSFLEPRSIVMLEKTSSFSSGDIFRDDTDSSCYESTTSACVLDTTQWCLKIPQEMKKCQFYCLEYINEIHCYWKMMESNAVFPVDSGILSKQSLMTNHHYSIVTNWMIGVTQEFKLLNDTIYIAVNLMNQYLKHKDVAKGEIQLVGVTSLYVASKLEETDPPRIGDFKYVTADTYSTQEIRAQELYILDTLHYLKLPFSLQFLWLYAKLTQTSLTECAMAMYVLELSLLDSSFATIKPSLKAIAALTLAKSLLKAPRQHWEGSEVWNYTNEELKEVKEKLLACLTQYHNHRHLRWINRKYSKKNYIEISRHPALDCFK